VGLANALTILRILLVPVLVWLLVYHRPGRALVVFATAALTDLLDGWVARRSRPSRLGAFLDPTADKLLLASAFVTLTYLGALPVWITAIVISRDVILGVGALLILVMVGRLHPRPTLAGKVATLFQVLTILGALVGEYYHRAILPAWVIVLVAACTIVSGAQYIVQGVRFMGGEHRAEHERDREATHSR